MQLLLFFILTLLPLDAFCAGLRFSSDYKGPLEPAFEKIYVSLSQLVTCPDGIYYRDGCDQLTKVSTVSADCDGMYVLLITHQCTLCGRCYQAGDEIEDEYGCPLYMHKIHPRVWID
jgi:hypothetical protein